MKILALEKETAGAKPHQFAPHLRAEAMHLWHLYQDGVVRELYFRQDRPEAVLLLECADINAARAILDTLPLVLSGLIDFELIPLIPYPGFARLFSS